MSFFVLWYQRQNKWKNKIHDHDSILQNDSTAEKTSNFLKLKMLHQPIGIEESYLIINGSAVYYITSFISSSFSEQMKWQTNIKWPIWGSPLLFWVFFSVLTGRDIKCLAVPFSSLNPSNVAGKKSKIHFNLPQPTPWVPAQQVGDKHSFKSLLSRHSWV